jgi:tetratricopeptide (TPR) repeat protein
LAYYKKGDYESAIEDCNRAIELDPNHPNAYNVRGVVYYKRGDYKSAIEDYTKAIDLNPDYAETCYNRGEARLHLEEWEEARIDLVYAKNRGMDIIVEFQKEHGTVANFQRQTGITLPEDIAEMLTPTQP